MVNYDYEFRERKGALDPSGKPKYVMDMKFIMERGENEESLKKYKESVLELFDLKDEKEEKKEGGDRKS